MKETLMSYVWKNIFKYSAVAAVAVILPFLFSKTVNADRICTPNYGGGETCTETNLKSVRIEKEVSFKDKDFKDRIKGATAKDTIYFRITVKNEGDVTLENLKVEDDLPKYIKAKDDTDWTINKLEPGKEWSEVFKAEVVDEDDLPDNDVCVVNEAKVKLSGKSVSEDTATVCIESPTKVLGVKELPVTGGPNIGGKEAALGVIAFGMAMFGLGIRRVYSI